MKRYTLEVIKAEDTETMIIECDDMQVNSAGCYTFYDEFEVGNSKIERRIASYPINRTIIRHIKYNIENE
jgi:hypothetical protein